MATENDKFAQTSHILASMTGFQIKNPAPSWASISDTTSSPSPIGTTYIPSSIATTTFPPTATPTFTHTTTRPVSTAPESVGIVDYSECCSIADYIATGQSFPSITSSKGGQLFLDTIVNRTDTNFTFFGVSSDAIFLDESILKKFRSPLWNGHVVRCAREIVRFVLHGVFLENSPKCVSYYNCTFACFITLSWFVGSAQYTGGSHYRGASIGRTRTT